MNTLHSSGETQESLSDTSIGSVFKLIVGKSGVDISVNLQGNTAIFSTADNKSALWATFVNGDIVVDSLTSNPKLGRGIVEHEVFTLSLKGGKPEAIVDSMYGDYRHPQLTNEQVRKSLGLSVPESRPANQVDMEVLVELFKASELKKLVPTENIEQNV